MLALVLKSRGYDVLLCSNGAEARSQIESDARIAEQVAGANREAATGAQAGQNRQIARRLQGLDEQHTDEPRQRRAAP